MRAFLLGCVFLAGCRIGCRLDDYDRGYNDGACAAGTRWCAMIAEQNGHMLTPPCAKLEAYCTGGPLEP